MERTIGLAIHLEIMPSFQNAYEGRTVRNTYAGVGAAAGVLASQLAGIGITPERDALGSVYEGIISPWLDPVRITEELGKRFEITLGFIKPYPMCRFGHPALEATEALVKEHRVIPEEIEEVEVRTFSWAATLDDPAPRTDLGAKFSVPWAVASMLVRKSAGADDFRNKSLSDPLVRSVAAKVRVKEDPVYTSMTPAKRPARVTVKTKQGKVYTSEVERSGGGPDAPLSKEKIQEKFLSLAGPVIGKAQAGAVIEQVETLEGLEDIRDLTRLLVPPSS
jgi:2-methylcitrate dehydratase PrpD